MIAKKTVIGLAGVATVIAAVSLGAEIVARGWAVQQVDVLLSRPPFTKASHGAITYSLLRGRIAIDTLHAETSIPQLPSLSAAHVDLDGIGIFYLRNWAASGSRLSGLTAEQLELTLPGGHESFGVLSARDVESKGVTPEGGAAMLVAVSARRVDGQDFHAWNEGKSRGTHIAALTIDDIRAGPWRGGEVTRATSDAAPPTLAIATATAAKITVLAAGNSASADRLEVAGLRLSAGNGQPTSGTPAAIWDTPLSQASVERVDAAQLAIALPNGESLHVDRFHTGALAAGRLDALEIDNLVAQGKAGHFRLGAFAVENLAYDAGELPLRPPRVFLGRLRLADLAGGPKPDAQIMVQELVLTMEGNLDKRTGAALKVSGVQVSAAAAPMLRLIGYDTLSLEMSGRSSYDETEGIVDSRSMIAAAEAGRLGVAMRLSKYPAETPSMVSDLLTHLRETQLDRFELRYEDASLADHLLKLYGGFSGRDAEGMRAALIAQVMARRDAYTDNARLRQSLDTVIAFLRRPGAIAVRLAPPTPVRFEELSTIFAQGDLGAAADRLGLSIE